MYALVQGGVVTETRPWHPQLWWDGARWWDLRSGQHDPGDAGWHEVVETDRPEDTDTDTYTSTVELVDGAPTVVWTARPWTAEELAERAEGAAIADLRTRLAAVEAHLWPPDPEPVDPVPGDYPPFAGIWHPGTIISDGGTLWRNVSGVPLTSAPSEFPGDPSRWAHLFVEVATAPEEPETPDPTYPQWRGEWSATAEYVVGDHVTRGGVVYKCLVAHGAAYAGTWGPPAAGVWIAV